MNNIIPQTNKNKRYLPHDFQTKIHALQMYLNCGDIGYVCRKYHISRISLWRWTKKLMELQKMLENKKIY